MSEFFKLFVSFTIVVLSVCTIENVARKAPDFLQPCPGLKPECLKKRVQETLPMFSKGIPELNVLPIDPLREDYTALTLPGGFKVELFNGTSTGLRKCIIDSVTYEHETQVADLKAHCNITIKGPYKASGRILIVAINGEGLAKIKLINSALHAKIHFEDKVRDGITYFDVKDFSVNQTYGDRVIFNITNLFQGNPTLSEAVLTFLNENWKQIAEEFGKPMVDKFVDLVYKNVKPLFESVPKEELFIL